MRPRTGAPWSRMVVALAFLGPLLVLLLKGNDSAWVRRQAVESLNFQISILIYAAISFVLLFLLVGFVLLPIVGLLLAGRHHPRLRAQPRRPGLPLPADDPAGRAEAGSRQQVADHGVGEQPAAPGEHRARPSSGSSSPSATSAGDRREPGRRPSTARSRPVAQPHLQQHPLDAPALARRAPRAPCAGLRPGGEPVGVRRRVLDVPPAHAADVGVRAGTRRPTSRRRSSRAGCAGSGWPRRAPSSTPRTTPARRRRGARRRAGTCRRGRRRRSSAPRRDAPAGPARCRPPRSASTPRRGRVRRPAPRPARSPSRPATPRACRRSGRG